MSASPAVAQPIPGAQPGADVDQAPPDGTAPPTGTIEEEPPDRRRRRRVFLLLFLLAALIGLLLLTLWYLLFRQPIPIPTIPGQVVMPGYVTSAYGVDRPMGIAVTAAGDRMWVGETSGNQTARVMDGSGNQLGVMQPPVSTGSEHVPVYLAFNPLTSEVYVSDRPTGSIYVYDANGDFLREFSPDGLEGWQPLGLAFDAKGNLFVTDVGSNPQRVLEFDPSGTLVRTIGMTADLSFPNGVAVDAAGYVYVTDSNNGRLLVFDTDDNVVARVGRGVGVGDLGLPRGVTIDDRGRVYVADSSGQAVFVYATVQPGTDHLDFLGSFGDQGIGDGQFEYPNGLAVDGRGRIYVTDSANDRVQVWSY